MSGLLRYYEVSDLERLSREECFALGENLARVVKALSEPFFRCFLVREIARDAVVRLCRKAGRQFELSNSTSPGMIQLGIDGV